MARVVREKEYNKREKEIIDVAQKFICNKGYRQMSTQDILNELHISKRACYRYFGSKQNLIKAIIARMYDETSRSIQSGVEDEDLLYNCN